MTRRHLAATFLFIGLIAGGAAIAPLLDAAHGASPASPQTQPATPSIVAATPEEAGRYLVSVAGCNDCHTPEYDRRGNAVPESQWLIGVAMGFKGPWGTSYAPNLRAKVQTMPEDNWVAGVKAMNGRPPMPWNAIHAMSDADLHSLYRYIHTLGPSENKIPAPLPPGETPKTPYVVFDPVMPR